MTKSVDHLIRQTHDAVIDYKPCYSDNFLHETDTRQMLFARESLLLVLVFLYNSNILLVPYMCINPAMREISILCFK